MDWRRRRQGDKIILPSIRASFQSGPARGVGAWVTKRLVADGVMTMLTVKTKMALLC